jgi:ribonuclease BN (tRNA processing enzyme)
LIHEVRSLAGLAKRPPAFQRFASKYHTTTAQLAELATQAKPRLLILYHHAIVRPGVNPEATSPADLLAEMSARYAGHVVIGHDLDVY